MTIQKTSFPLHQKHVPPFQMLAEENGWALDVSGTGDIATEDTDTYILTWFIPTDESALFADKLTQLCAATSHPAPTMEWQDVQEENWQEKAMADFPPIEIGPFFITRNDEPVPAGRIEMKIPAAMAFGSGEHATTTGCLHLFEQMLTQGHAFDTGLDMGAGSGILAIAAIKLYQQKYNRSLPFLCIDNDEPSVEICMENAIENNVGNQVVSAFGDGFNTPAVQEHGQYPLIFANILMQPLIDMAPALMNKLQPGGIAILSGFLQEQVPHIQTAYSTLSELGRYDNGDWCALALQKTA